MKNKALILSVLLIFCFMITAVSAANETDIISDKSDVTVQKSLSDETVGQNPEAVKTTITTNNTNIVKGEKFSVRLSDVNSSSPVKNQIVTFTFNGKTTNITTDNNGIAKLKINVTPGTYTVKYSFSANDGYLGCSNLTDIFVIPTSNSTIKASSYTAYVGVVNKYTVTLSAGSTPLSGRVIVFKINDKTYRKTTDAEGKASININEPKGVYTLSYSYEGEDNINPASGSVKITVKQGMPVKISRNNYLVYLNKKAGYFKVILTDARGSPLKSKKIVFKVKGKKYTTKTDSAGVCKLKIKLKTGNYKVKAYFAKTSVYNKYSKTFTIKVKTKHAYDNGMWLFGRDMKSVNFLNLQKNGFKHIFLNFKAVELYGKAGVEQWVKTAKSYGLNVHIWMQVFYNGGWQNPLKNGKINYNFINSKVAEAKSYAKINGISGVHFDYIRFPGNANHYKNSVKAVNTFVKQASNAVHGVNKKLIVSAAVMPEPSSMKKYYAQDIKTMGKYLDVIVPMAYKGNYHGGHAWIKYVTKTLKKQSSKAKIWTGLQTYKSDSSLKPLSAKELKGDAATAVNAGASGIILFRFGLFNYINFNEV